MESIRSESEAFVQAVERHVHRTFRFHHEIALLLEIAEKRSLRQEFEDLTFHAKFITNACVILQREGAHNESTRKLSAEFQGDLERISDQLRSFVNRESPEVQEIFLSQLVGLSPHSAENLLQLLAELASVKNYSLDMLRSGHS